MNLSKSVDFLLEEAGPVIQYRLRKEILHTLSVDEEEKLLEQIFRTPHMMLLQGYRKPNGYIGRGIHSWDNWGGTRLHETPLQDGETAARLLSYYAIPKTHPMVRDYVSAMRDEDILREEFSYIPPEMARYETRFKGMNSGYGLMLLIYAMQAMLGCGDEAHVKHFQDTAIESFRSLLALSSISDITKTRQGKTKYGDPYLEESTYFPCQYHLEALAYTHCWRTAENVDLMADALNHYSAIIGKEKPHYIKIGNRFYVPFPLNMRNVPIRSFRTDRIDSITYRRLLTEIAMLGVGDQVAVLRETLENIKEAMVNDGILQMDFGVPHSKRYSPLNIEYPTAYIDVRLEHDYQQKNVLLCDLTFWAVQILHLCGEDT